MFFSRDKVAAWWLELVGECELGHFYVDLSDLLRAVHRSMVCLRINSTSLDSWFGSHFMVIVLILVKLLLPKKILDINRMGIVTF